MVDYITIQELQSFMGDSWDDSYSELAETWLIPYGSAGLRQLFRNQGADLDARLSSGELELVVLKAVLCEMIVVSLEAQSSNLPFGESSQLSQSAGGYSISMSGLSGSNLFLRKSQAKILGLPGMSFESFRLN